MSMTNDSVSDNCSTWTLSVAHLLSSRSRVSKFSQNYWGLSSKASLIRRVFIYHLDLVLILFVFDNSSSRASCVSSTSSVGWVCRRLLPHIVYQQFLCIMSHLDLFTQHPIRTKLIILSPQVHGRPDLLHEIKREALELHSNSAMKDNVELPGDVQLDAMQNETTRVCKWFTMLSGSNLILSQEPF